MQLFKFVAFGKLPPQLEAPFPPNPKKRRKYTTFLTSIWNPSLNGLCWHIENVFLV
jgi:hypothetical protein